MATDHNFKVKHGITFTQDNHQWLTGNDNNIQGKIGATGAAGLVLKDSGNTFRVQLYGEGGHYGFLNSEWGGWDLKKTVGGSLYLNNNTTYSLRPDGTTNLNNLNVAGNLTVSGTTTTLNTATLQVEDKNIVLNYGTGDTSSSADGAGITIQDAVNSSTDATILWSASSDRFNFSHKISVAGDLSAYHIFGQDHYVLNANADGWHKWAERSGGKVNLNVNSISSGAITASGTITASNGTVIVGTSSTNSTVRSYWSDGSYTDYNGYGIEFARTASYIRPNNDNVRYMQFGTSTQRWSQVQFHTPALKMGTTTFLDDSRNLTNIGTITNSGKISSSIGSYATYSRPLLEITNGGTPTQIKITTNILYSGTGASTHAHSVTIRGFQYGNAQMADLQIGWHVYLNQFYNRSVTSSGSWAPTVTLAVENNKVVIHLASPGYWPKLYVESMYNAYGGAGQASGWSWSDAAISADANTPNVTVPYKFDYGNGVLMSGGTTVIDSSRNLTNIGTISSGAITSSGNSVFTGGNSDGTGNAFEIKRGGNSQQQAIRVQNTGEVVVSNNYLYAAHTGTSFYSQGDAVFRATIRNDTSGMPVKVSDDFNVTGDIQSNGTVILQASGRNLTNIGTISSGAITSTGNMFLTGELDITKSGSLHSLVLGNRDAFADSSSDSLIWITSGNGTFKNGQGAHLVFEGRKDSRNFYFKVGNVTAPQHIMHNSGYVGFGTGDITPTDRVHVDGTVRASSYKIGTTEVINSSGQFTGGLNPSSLSVGGTTVIDSSRNLTNINTLELKASNSSNKWIAYTYTDNTYRINYNGAGADEFIIDSDGRVGIGTTSLSSGYKLNVSGNLNMNNSHIHYANEVHFNSGTRFKTLNTSTTLHRSNHATSSSIALDTNGTIRGYVGGNSDSGHSVGLFDQGGNWGVRHINDQGTVFYADGGTQQAAIGSDLVSGGYGGMVLYSAKSGYVGYSLNNRAVFMHNNSTTTGIYNDVGNEWYARFVQDGAAELYHNGHRTLFTQTPGAIVDAVSGQSSVQIQLTTNGTSRGYVYGNDGNNLGFLDAGGNWAIRHLENQGTEFRQNNTVHALIGQSLVSGTYGSMTVNDTKNGWGGYSINNRVLFMHDHGNTAGLYNDVNNHWLVKTQNGGATELYFNGSKKLETTTSGAVVTGNIAHDGLTMTSGTDVDQLYTVTDSLTLTTSYQDTSINSSELATGTYIMQMYAHDHGNGGSHYNEFYSGVISWYGAGTNSSEVDEIVLHRAGHAPNSSVIHLRTQRHPSGGDNLVLQIKANYTRTAASNYTFKFRRMI